MSVSRETNNDHESENDMSDTLPAVEIPADVKDSSETVTNYAFMRHRSPGRGVVGPAERDRTITTAIRYLIGHTHYQWQDVNPDGQRCRFDMITDREGDITELLHTEYWTRVTCTDCEYSYADTFIAVTDADGVTHPAAPFCDEHGRVVKRIAERMTGHSWSESERLRIGQHD